MSGRKHATPIVESPKSKPIDKAIDTIAQRKLEAEFAETVKLAEQIFPRDWNVRVEPFSDGVHVQVRYYVAHGPNAVIALRRAIDWYRGQGGSRIILPGQEGRK